MCSKDESGFRTLAAMRRASTAWSLLVAVVSLGLTLSVHGAPRDSIVLKGVVNQPVAPFGPAPNSVVRVFDSAVKANLAHDVTDDKGEFHLNVPKGQSLVVIATGRADEYMPGTLVIAPTARRRPRSGCSRPKASQDAACYNAGVISARNGAQTAELTAKMLYAKDLPAASIYEFVKGAKSESKQSFGEVDSSQVFRQGKSNQIASGMKDVQSQRENTSTVPSYTAFADRTGGEITPPEYVEILGFTTPQEEKKKNWEYAVNGSLGEHGAFDVPIAADKFDKSVFKSERVMTTH